MTFKEVNLAARIHNPFFYISNYSYNVVHKHTKILMMGYVDLYYSVTAWGLINWVAPEKLPLQRIATFI